MPLSQYFGPTQEDAVIARCRCSLLRTWACDIPRRLAGVDLTADTEYRLTTEETLPKDKNPRYVA
jgi:hypothetical protein